MLGAQAEHAPDTEDDLFIDWREEPDSVAPNDGDIVDHAYLKVAEGTFPRDMAPDEINDNYQEARKAKMKGINGPYYVECFKR